MGKLFDGNLGLLKVLEKECFNAFHVRQDLSVMLVPLVLKD